jgi:hypothetical protein
VPAPDAIEGGNPRVARAPAYAGATVGR